MGHTVSLCARGRTGRYYLASPSAPWQLQRSLADRVRRDGLHRFGIRRLMRRMLQQFGIVFLQVFDGSRLLFSSLGQRHCCPLSTLPSVGPLSSQHTVPEKGTVLRPDTARQLKVQAKTRAAQSRCALPVPGAKNGILHEAEFPTDASIAQTHQRLGRIQTP